MGALTGCFGIWMGKESKTTVTSDKVVHEHMTTVEDFMVYLMVKALEFLLNTKMSLYGTVIV